MYSYGIQDTEYDMARTGITYEQVAAVADALIGAGQQPTIKGVRERLGTGSPNTVHAHLVAWREARPVAVVEAPTLPASLTAAIGAEISQAAARARAEIEGELVRVQGEAAELARAGEVLEDQVSDLSEKLADVGAERDQAVTLAGERAAEITRLVEQVEREQHGAEAARVELATARLRLEGLAERQAAQAAEIARLTAALDEQRTARAAAEQSGAVLAARLEAATERAARAETAEQAGQREAVKARDELAQARLQVQAQQIALDTAARDVEGARKAAAEARIEATAAREQAATEARVQSGRIRELEIQAAELRGAKAAAVAPAEGAVVKASNKGAGARKGTGPQDLVDE
jgi:colicin import membrane protein